MSDETEIDPHNIFIKDPDEWMQYVYKQVNVLVEDGSEYTGWVYTIDPVSECIVLMTFNDDNTKMDIINGSSVSSISIIDEDTELHVKAKLDAMFRPKETSLLTEEELESLKKRLKLWLIKNRLPVQLTGNNDEILSISDALFIEPPYGADNCRSTNEIILGRIQGLIKNMPADHEDW
ncbi:gem-associated protein 6-like [Mytilus edulis]|uniref:gem-associated protein 6-like n=1 Tax=Mytilus edulis TaxID=6550 RepID=UPI0039F041BA